MLFRTWVRGIFSDAHRVTYKRDGFPVWPRLLLWLIEPMDALRYPHLPNTMNGLSRKAFWKTASLLSRKNLIPKPIQIVITHRQSPDFDISKCAPKIDGLSFCRVKDKNGNVLCEYSSIYG
jgi:hypothetical protein